MTTRPTGRDERGTRLRRLDDCLSILEQAHELDHTLVSERMAEVIGVRVATIHAGMSITEAIDEVLRHQEPYMVQMHPEQTRRVRRRREPFDVRLLLQRH